ncbi:MAG: hypothetical protein M3Z04_20760 [Chloroflexota bacterium]|nr:hypothetical protein [Chloroflexota bacterium]
MENVGVKLRDPIWQAIGAVLGVLALLISTLVAYDILKRSSQYSDFMIQATNTYGPKLELGNHKIALNVDGIPFRSLIIESYNIANIGTNPIRSEDFVERLRFSVDDPWELISIDPNTDAPPELKLTWHRVSTNTFEMDPTLFNPGDSVPISLLVATNDSSSTNKQLYSGGYQARAAVRIVNVPRIAAHPKQEQAPASPLSIFNVGVSLYGFALYIGTTLACALYILQIFLASHSGRIVRIPGRQFLLLTLIMLTSMASCFTIPTAMDPQKTPTLAWIQIIFQLLLIFI